MSLIYTQTAIKVSRVYSSSGIDAQTTVESGSRIEQDCTASVNSIEPGMFAATESQILTEKLARCDKMITSLFDMVDIGTSQMLVIALGASSERVDIENESKLVEDTRHYRSAQVLLFSDKFPQQHTISLDSRLGSHLRSLLRHFSEEKSNKAQNAKIEYTGNVIFANGTSGYFAHEILGHLLEADSFLNDEMILRRSGISFGARIAPETFNLVDTPFDAKHQINLNNVDDEGVPMREIQLISRGRIAGCLCTQKTAMELDRPDLSGCARRQSFRYPALPRMRNTRILPNDYGPTSNDLIHESPCVILQNAINGTVNPFTGDFVINGSGCLKESSQTTKLPNITVSGNLLAVLNSKMHIGKDFTQKHIQCRKAGQFLPVVVGGPTMKIEGLQVKSA